VIVCHCRVVTDRQVAAAVDSGARSLAGLCRSTGAGQDCGACVFSLKRLVCEHGAPLASQPVLSEVDVAAS
jgi:bacterioferritin-associated ferredoxin